MARRKQEKTRRGCAPGAKPPRAWESAPCSSVSEPIIFRPRDNLGLSLRRGVRHDAQEPDWRWSWFVCTSQELPRHHPAQMKRGRLTSVSDASSLAGPWRQPRTGCCALGA
ncbi:hypothetical protein MRX96_015182 [Rhipicephalus microplus]